MTAPAQTRKRFVLKVEHDAPGTAVARYVACPVNAQLVEIRSMIQTDIGQDITPANVTVALTTEIAGVSTGVSFSYDSGDAAGTAAKGFPSSKSVRAGQHLSATTDANGALTGAIQIQFVLEME